jgi:hypothetical protein
MYASASPIEGESQPVWAPFEPRLAAAKIGILTSAGLFLEGEQEPFDGEREKQEPTWGDPTYRVLPHALADRKIGMMHLHVNPADVLADHNVALPTDVLDELVADGAVGSATTSHVSVMGYQAAGLDVWRNETAPAIVSLFRDEGADGVVLAPV